MVAQDDAYASKDFIGGSPGADSVDKKISHGRPIGAPQFCYNGPKVGPPRLQFSFRHEWLRLTGGRSAASEAGPLHRPVRQIQMNGTSFHVRAWYSSYSLALAPQVLQGRSVRVYAQGLASAVNARA